MSSSTRRTLSVARTLVVALLCLGLSGAGAAPSPSAAAKKHGNKPNIVLILTDDQRWDTLWAMPHVRRLIVRHGLRFDQAFVVNPLCCPSRTSILTGQYSHGTDVYRNSPPHGGYETFRDSSTLATWLHRAGYRTALIGKYLNGYLGTTIPPGWDRWFAFTGNPSYYHYHVADQRRQESYQDDHADYSTAEFSRQAVSFIQQTRRPFFLYFAPYAPHQPALPGFRDVRAFSKLRPYRPPSYDEDDVGDKPAWVQAIKPMGKFTRKFIDRARRKEYRSLRAVDRAVERIVETLQDKGQLRKTMLVFMSDNGLMWGEHRVALSKAVPYDESIRVPMVIRYDPLTHATRADGKHLVLNIDLAPTFAALAGVSAPGADGRNLLPLLRSRSAAWRSDFLIEHLQEGSKIPPTYCAIRSNGYAYVHYFDSLENELYDVKQDPYELDNIAGDPAAAPVVAQMQARLQELCNPTPPRKPQ
jgi:arylsulfatase A-like enzyme